VAPVSDGVEAPGCHAANGEVDPLVAPIRAEAAQQVPRVERSATTSTRPRLRAVRRRQRREQFLASLHRRADRCSDAFRTDRVEQVTIGIDEPPAAIDLFHAEEAGGLAGLGALEAAVLAEAEIALSERCFLRSPSRLELLQVRRLARPLVVNPLAELVH